MFVSAFKGGGGTVLATAAKPFSSEAFHIIRNEANPSMVHIQANNGMYLQALKALSILHFDQFSDSFLFFVIG
jgi:hypothetical protein